MLAAVAAVANRGICGLQMHLPFLIAQPAPAQDNNFAAAPLLLLLLFFFFLRLLRLLLHPITLEPTQIIPLCRRSCHRRTDAADAAMMLLRLWYSALFLASSVRAASAAVGLAGFRDSIRSLGGETNAGVDADADADAAPAEPLRCFEVRSPVLTHLGLVIDDRTIEPDIPSYHHPFCHQTLMVHVFGNSYGQPFVADYKPPSGCPFRKVLIKLDVVSEGRQFDRLATMWLGDVEVWRTSTAEPKPRPGIAWTYWKDMSHYLALWMEPQKLIFDLGNLINERYTGHFNATLTAYFSAEGPVGPHARPANVVLPISARRSHEGKPSAFTYPDENAEARLTLPRNIQRAVVSISANGQAGEEFWWSNVPNEGADTFANVTLQTGGSFREVRLLIDGRLAGLSWPFPVIFTGGISPPLHRPMVGIDAFNLREQEIDVTPWLGLLADGFEHKFSLQVVGQGEKVVARYWIVSAKLFLWLSNGSRPSSGSMPKVRLVRDNYRPGVVSTANSQLLYNQTITRYLEVTSRVSRPSGTAELTWKQGMEMSNVGLVREMGNHQQVMASYRGEDKSTDDSVPIYYSSYKYPLATSYRSRSPDGPYSLTLDANLTQGQERVITGLAVFPTGLEAFSRALGQSQKRGIDLRTARSGRAFFYQRDGGKSSGGFGSMRQQFEFGGRYYDAQTPAFKPNPILFSREVAVVNETTTVDRIYLWNSTAQPESYESKPMPMADEDSFAGVPTHLAEGGVSSIASGDPLRSQAKALVRQRRGAANERHPDTA
ncbi:hypothetical protein RJ55_03264 [Drechmeria coniospora]|nr:hypothetical protein RJ55_03264 [Drechmeria coniospora]